MTLPTGQKQIKKNGFTLVELLLVCTITMLLLGMVIPQVIGSLSRLEIEDTCRDIAALIKYAQAKAITEQTCYRLNIDLEQNRYWLTYQDNSNDSSYQRLKTSIGKTYYLPREINIDSLSFEIPDLAGQSYIGFYPDGAVDSVVIKISDKHKDSFLINITGRLGQVIVEGTNG